MKKLLTIIMLLLAFAASAQKQTINRGTPNGGNGDKPYVMAGKCNHNFTELYNAADSARNALTGQNFITSLTMSSLSDMIDNSSLVTGLQYYVTDKDWLLVAISQNKLVPVAGYINLMNGESLPDGVVPEVLYIDTGVISTDISQNGGTPLQIYLPVNYIPVVAVTRVNDESADIASSPILYSISGIILNNGMDGNAGVVLYSLPYGAFSGTTFYFSCDYVGQNNTTIHTIIKLERSKF